MTSTRKRLRLLGLLGTALLLCVTLACINRPMKNARPNPVIAWALSIPQSAERDVDILFVIDNSGSMREEQILLMAQFSALMEELKNITGGLPNVHIGVTSSDLGTSPFVIGGCEAVGGDAGRLLTGSCTNPQGAPFIADVEPSSCEITKDPSGVCSAHSCTQEHCDSERAPNFVVDGATGCPRCRNYLGDELEDVFSCIANLGVEGCGFEQHLEAMYKALDPANNYNRGFIRENAFLAVIFLADEDDCSAAAPQLFDTSQSSMDSQLGPVDSFRCFEFGVVCDINGRNHQGLRTGCKPNDDPGALLHPVGRYINFLTSIKDPQMLVVAGILGPVFNDQVTVGLHPVQGTPMVMPSCDSDNGKADPAIRIKAVIEAFHLDEKGKVIEEDMVWAMSSICATNYTDALHGIGEKIGFLLDVQCPPQPLRGCADPGAEFGHPWDQYEGNDVCLATCHIMDVSDRNSEDETRQEVPPCLEVCPQGPCPGNTDRSLAYALGHPLERDEVLPVSACWHVNYQPLCEQSHFAEIIVSRREDPPARSFADVICNLVPAKELLCNDDVDNDEDGLVDMDDPDCWE